MGSNFTFVTFETEKQKDEFNDYIPNGRWRSTYHDGILAYRLPGVGSMQTARELLVQTAKHGLWERAAIVTYEAKSDRGYGELWRNDAEGIVRELEIEGYAKAGAMDIVGELREDHGLPAQI